MSCRLIIKTLPGVEIGAPPSPPARRSPEVQITRLREADLDCSSLAHPLLNILRRNETFSNNRTAAASG